MREKRERLQKFMSDFSYVLELFISCIIAVAVIILCVRLFGSMVNIATVSYTHLAGAFPAWLAPVQVKVLPISDKYMEYGMQVKETLEKYGIRVEIDTRKEKIGYKIREARLEKVPYMLIVGEKEQEENAVSRCV